MSSSPDRPSITDRSCADRRHRLRRAATVMTRAGTRRRLIAAVVLPVVLTAVTLSPASAAPAPASATLAAAAPAPPLSQADLSSYLTSLANALHAVSANPRTASGVSANLANYSAELNMAQAQVPNLTPSELATAGTILGQHPGWSAQPAAIAAAVGTPAISHSSIVPSPFPGYLSSCSGSLPDNRGLFYGSWAAAQAAAAASAVAAASPDAVDYAALLIITGVAFGVANGIAIGLQYDLTQGVDCATAAFNSTLEGTYPTDSSVGGFTPASSQISVDALAAVAGNVKTTLDNIQTVMNTVTSKLSSVINALGTAQGTANAIQSTATDLQSRTDALVATVGTSSDTGTTTANGLANTINAQMVTVLGNTASLQNLTLRMEIERDLATANSPVITLYALPASHGGYLEMVQTLVATTINNEIVAGQTTGQSQVLLGRGNTDYQAGKYEAAFIQYALAYKSAVL